jgi:hypothetical protein
VSGEIAIIAKIAKIAGIETRERPHDFQLSTLAVLAILAIARHCKNNKRFIAGAMSLCRLTKPTEELRLTPRFTAFTF